MDEDRNRSSGNSPAELGSSEPDISDVIRVLRAAAGIGDNEQPTGQLTRQMHDKPTANEDTELPKDRVEFSPEALKKLSERPTAKAVEKAESSLPNVYSDEAKNALDFFRKMSGVAGAQTPQMPDKSAAETSRSSAKKTPEKTSPKATAKTESSLPNVYSDEAKNALDFFRKMSGVTGEKILQTPDKSAVETFRSSAEKTPEKTSPKAAEKVKSSLPNVDSDEAKNALNFFRKMSGVTGEKIPQTPDKSAVEISLSSAEKPPEKTYPKAAAKAENSSQNADSDEAKNALDIFRKMSGVTSAETTDKSAVETSRSNVEKPPEKTHPKAAAKTESSPPNVDSDEAENALKFFREMSGVTGSEPTEQAPDKSNDLVDEASAEPVRDEQIYDGDGQTQTENIQNAEPENAEQPRPYKPFDITDIPKTEVYVPPSDEPEENITEKCSLAVCGADCNDCPFGEENDCPGCGGLWEDCDIVRCAAVKGHEHCGLCDKFPCDLLREAAFDPDSGDNGDRLLRLKSLGEAANSRRKPRLIMAGGCGGIALGTAIGGFSGALLPWIFAMTVVGAGVGLMAAVSVKNKGQTDRGKKQEVSKDN